MKQVFIQFFISFIIIILTSFYVAAGISIDVDPIILAGAFLAYYKAAKELDKAIKKAEEYNRKKEEEAISKSNKDNF